MDTTLNFAQFCAAVVDAWEQGKYWNNELQYCDVEDAERIADNMTNSYAVITQLRIDYPHYASYFDSAYDAIVPYVMNDLEV